MSYVTSVQITSPLTKKIKDQELNLPEPEEVKEARSVTMSALHEAENNRRTEFLASQTIPTQRNIEQLSQPGASTWLSALPLKEQGFNLNKGEFQDAMNLRYDKPLRNLPSKCPCSKKFTVTHAMNCNRGGFVSVRHNTIRNFEGQLLKQICNDVQIEPPPSSLSTE